MKFPQCLECGTRLSPEAMTCSQCGAPANQPLPTPVRCECGFLLGKLNEDAIEIKCRRCKRLVYIPVTDLPARFKNNQARMKDWQAGLARRVHAPEPRGIYCSSCGQHKTNVVYGKCLDCRTESIKVQYKGRVR